MQCQHPSPQLCVQQRGGVLPWTGSIDPLVLLDWREREIWFTLLPPVSLAGSIAASASPKGLGDFCFSAASCAASETSFGSSSHEHTQLKMLSFLAHGIKSMLEVGRIVSGGFNHLHRQCRLAPSQNPSACQGRCCPRSSRTKVLMPRGEGRACPGAFPRPPSLRKHRSGARCRSELGWSQGGRGEKAFYSPLVLPRAVQPLSS